MHKTTNRKNHRTTYKARQLRHAKNDSYVLFDRLENIKDSLSAISGNFSDKTSDIVAQAIKKARAQTVNLQKNVDRFVTRKPYKSLGILFLTCACVALLLRNKK